MKNRHEPREIKTVNGDDEKYLTLLSFTKPYCS